MDTIRRSMMDGEHNLMVGELLPDPATALQKSEYLSRPTAAHFDLNILSAATYPHVPTEAVREDRTSKSSNVRSSRQLFGGLVAPSSDSARLKRADDEPSREKPPPRKRSKRSSKSDDDDGGKKQRGRPRLDTRDETAAERRRTQIRLAQRAYRHRKETTISVLKRRVSELENGIGSMNNSFIRFQEDAIESGILASRPDLIHELRAVAEQFSRLIESSLPHSDHEDENVADLAHSNSPTRSPEPVLLPTFELEQPRDVAMDDPLGFKISFDESGSNEEENADPMSLVPMQTSFDLSPNGMTRITPQQWPVINPYWQFDAPLPEDPMNLHTIVPQIDRPLEPAGPYTYSFQETTFARRLHRLCLEKGFRLLTHPKQHQEELMRTFRFTFCFSNKKFMLTRFQELLKRKAGESLEYWDVPFFRIGGAGTHFPRRDDQGKAIYPPNMHSPARAFGPRRPLSYGYPETPRDEASVERIIDAIGYGGEWFDSHDVEEYLRTKGISFDGQSSFVDIDPMAVVTPPLVHTESASSTQSEESLEYLAVLNHIRPYTGENAQQEGLFDDYGRAGVTFPEDKFVQEGLVDGAEMPIWDQSMEISNATMSRRTASFRDLLERRRPLVTVDVGKFLEQLVGGSACLGRAPGFRRQDVDNALNLALQEAF